MASIISSANRGTASVFDLVTETTTVISQSLRVVSRATDALDVKARELHESVTAKSLSNIVIIRKREIMNAATEYLDLLEANYRHVTGKNDFDRAAQYDAIVAEMQAAVEAG